MTLRDFPPVEPVDPPSRLSQTLLARFNVCPRSAYLSLKHNGGKASHRMDAGSAMHEGIARATLAMIEQGETSIPADVGKALLEQAIVENPQWVIPIHERPGLRQSLWHWCEFGQPIDPAKVLGVEQLFVLDVAGQTLSGKLDLLTRDEAMLEIVDYKLSMAVPTDEEFQASWQTRFYAVLAMLGKPVARNQCVNCGGKGQHAFNPGHHEPCESCDGKGYIELVAPFGIGDGATHVRVAERYPSLDPRKSSTGMVVERATILSRADVHEVLTDIEAKVKEFDQALESWRFEARDGTHCSTCAAPAECPIPSYLRDSAGLVRSEAEAEEAASQWAFMTERAAKLKRAVREFAKKEGLGQVRLGSDEALRFRHQESRSVTDWEGLSRAIEEAAEYGRPLDRDRFVRVRKSTNFERVKLTPEER